MDGAILNVANISVLGIQVDGYVENGGKQSGRSELILYQMWAKPFKPSYKIRNENIIKVINTQ